MSYSVSKSIRIALAILIASVFPTTAFSQAGAPSSPGFQQTIASQQAGADSMSEMPMALVAPPVY